MFHHCSYSQRCWVHNVDALYKYLCNQLDDKCAMLSNALVHTIPVRKHWTCCMLPSI